MTTGGSGIPRLQELSYLEVAAQGVADGCTFEEIRRRLVDHMAALGEMSTGTGNTALHQNASVNPKRYVHNVTEALKELMKLGLLERATLPSSATSAHAHRLAHYQLTSDGTAWVATLEASRSDGYAQLTEQLLRIHPQFEGFLKTVGAMVSDQRRDAFLIPLIRWGDVSEPRTQERYIAALAKWAADGVSSGHCGWIAAEDEIATFIAGYVKDITERAAGRERPDPFARNQAFVTACEEAMVKFAFGRAGTPIDYISMEILRRWTRTLALVNFSYHAPGPQALRLWPTATVTFQDGRLDVQRRVGPTWRDAVPKALHSAFDRLRRSEPTGSLWIPIYRIRAAVCWELHIPDSEFDAAVLELLRGERGADLPFRVNLDQSSYGSVPPSERALVVNTRNGPRIFKSLSLVARSGQPAHA
jgi:hypothetical protein